MQTMPSDLPDRLEAGTHNMPGIAGLLEGLRFVAEKGKAVSRMVALAVCTGWLSGMLFSGPVAWYLRWRVHPAMLSAALIELLRGMDIQPFCNTIPLASRTAGLLEPIGSRERKTG